MNKWLSDQPTDGGFAGELQLDTSETNLNVSKLQDDVFETSLSTPARINSHTPVVCCLT